MRNVKKGAEPSNGLRDKLKDIIYKTVDTLRKQIRSNWDSNEAAEQQESGVHKDAEDIAAKARPFSKAPCWP